MKLYSVIKEGRVDIGEPTPGGIKVANYQTEEVSEDVANAVMAALPNRFATKAFSDEAKKEFASRRNRQAQSAQNAQQRTEPAQSTEASDNADAG